MDDTGIKFNLWPIHFEAKISIGADIEQKKLFLVHRTWGEIMLKDQSVLVFSHHTKKDNFPFYSLSEWPELDLNSWDEELEVIKEWTPEEWATFFRKRILMKSKSLRTKSEAKRKDASELEERANVLLYALLE